MKTESLFELAELAKEKGFTTQTVTTNWTNNYLLKKGKDMLLNNMCFYLWLCELSKWLEHEHSINLQVLFYYSYEKPYELTIDYKNQDVWYYVEMEQNMFENRQQALEKGCFEGLKLIK